ncbi:uncharacterized protein [Halyomorpha halys]|uniref:uncharacterized protein n=1 Tax=Halyomorpha halys TaxID=286706 RepID=UPI0034D2E761
MRKTIQEIIGNSEVSLRTKYDRHPPKGTQAETPTVDTPLVELQIDTRGYKRVTVIDLFSKDAKAHQIRERSAEVISGALRSWFQFYGVSERISSNAGTELDNASVREEMKALEVRWHLNTPGHPKNREGGGIERLHGTLSDHWRMYQLDKGLEPDEAMIRAITAYNHSVHTVTGFALFKILFGLRGRKHGDRRRGDRR